MLRGQVAIGSANPWEGAVVVTVTIAVAGAPLNDSELGETLQVDMAGAPLQVRETV